MMDALEAGVLVNAQVILVGQENVLDRPAEYSVVRMSTTSPQRAPRFSG